MRTLIFSLLVFLAFLVYGAGLEAQTSVPAVLTTNLSPGSSGPQVIALQKILNLDSSTRIASVGPGSPGNETGYFGPLTKTAVARFQTKYASEVLSPAGLTQASGYVGFYTRTKLNSLSSLGAEVGTVPPVSTTSTATPSPVDLTQYTVTPSEQVDIYTADKMALKIQDGIIAAIDAAISSHSMATITPPTLTAADYPSATIQSLSSQAAVPGTTITIQGYGIGANSVVYFGNNYIIRKLNMDSLGNLTFVVPPIPRGRYDIAARTGTVISTTAGFVITDPKNPPVHVESVSPATIRFGDTLTIIGSGFEPQNNVVVTSYQTFTNVPSTDGKTLVVTLTPASLRSSVPIGDGKHPVPMNVSVVNDYGFSDTTKQFTLNI